MSESRSKQAPQWPVTPVVKTLPGRRTPVVLPYIYGEAQPGRTAPANSPTISEAVRLCEKAVAEAWQMCKDKGSGESEMRTSLRLTWLACMPPLDCVHNIRIYCALLAWGKTQLDVSHAELKSYAYLAQVALQALNAEDPAE